MHRMNDTASIVARPDLVALRFLVGLSVVLATFAPSLASATQEPAAPPTDCASLRAWHEAWIAAIPRETHGLETTFACVPDGAGGFWGHSIGSVLFVAPSADDPDGSITGSYQLVRFDDGEMRTVAEFPLVWQRFRRDVRRLATSDFDRDGTVELVWTTFDDGAETLPDLRVEIVDWVDEALVPYGPAAELAVHAVEDLDGDGVLDLLTYSPYRAQDLDGMYDETVYGPDVPYITRPDGSFSAEHPASLARLAASCAEVPDVLTIESFGQPLIEAIACARHRGAPVGLLTAHVGTFAAAEPRVMDVAEVLAAIAVEPTVSLPAP